MMVYINLYLINFQWFPYPARIHRFPSWWCGKLYLLHRNECFF